MEKSKRSKEEVPDTEYLPLQELKTRNKTSEAVHCGVCAKYGWHVGKQVKEKEYQDAVREFLKAGTGGELC